MSDTYDQDSGDDGNSRRSTMTNGDARRVEDDHSPELSEASHEGEASMNGARFHSSAAANSNIVTTDDPAMKLGLNGHGADVEYENASSMLGAAVAGVVTRLNVERDEVVAAAIFDRLALILDVPRAQMVTRLAEESGRRVEELLIEALDRLFDQAD